MKIVTLSDTIRFDTIEVSCAFVLDDDTNCVKISDHKAIVLDVHYGIENRKYMSVFELSPERMVRPAKMLVEF